MQVHTVLAELGKALGLRAVALYGGVGMQPQTQALRRGVDIVVACPGRLLDHIDRGNVRFDDLSVLVLDEADRMLDMGFLPDIKRVLRVLPKRRQTMMFSATFPKEIARMAVEFQHDPVRVEIGQVATPVEAVRQGIYTVDPRGKLDLLTTLLAKPGVESAPGLPAHEAPHGSRGQGPCTRRASRRRPSTVAARRDNASVRWTGSARGATKSLVATDVAARGLDIQGITHSGQLRHPRGARSDYIHRIGRTALRPVPTATRSRLCVPRITPELATIERALGKALPREDWDGAVLVRSGFQAGRERRQQASRASAPGMDGLPRTSRNMPSAGSGAGHKAGRLDVPVESNSATSSRRCDEHRHCESITRPRCRDGFGMSKKTRLPGGTL